MISSRPARWLVVGACVAVAVGVFLALARHQDDRIPEASVDAGFARDMAVHHAQAVQMAAYAQDQAPTAEVRALASTIALQQQLEIGQMLGWLDGWELPRASDEPAMAWMTGENHNHGHAVASSAMPGMATPTEMDALLNLQGEELEVRFLQLMIRHHHGGLPMAKAGARGAKHPYVRDFAGQMVVAQAEETDRMLQLLRARGGRALPAP